MEWLRFDGLERWYGARQVFANLSGALRDGAKVGLVGPNGAGKSSLVRILAGVDTADHGSVTRARDARLGYLSQNASDDQEATLHEILSSAFARYAAEEARVRELEHELSAAAESGDDERQARALRAYGAARDALDRHGGEGLERKMRSMLTAFGFSEADLDRPAGEFSGGQRTRAALARTLLEEPDYLILDEPTNHLDLETVRWLEDFLNNDARAVLVISHDRYFLDRVAGEIWELDGESLERYEVPRGRAYSAYVEEKTVRADLAQREYDNYLAEEKRRKAVIAELRTHGSHNYAQVRSREKNLAKLERVEAPRTAQKRIAVRLDATRRATSGLALEADGLSKAYGKPLFRGLDLDVQRGGRLAIVGPNGAGKSTLLDILSGRAAPDAGKVKIPQGVRFAYFAQDAADDLPAGKTAIEAVGDGAVATIEEVRSLLGRLGLGGEAGDKLVEEFSGGERRRIMLARLMAQAADLLFLDEPTNDLDIPSREALESVLAAYGGALVVVSHDRYLLARLAEDVLWLRDGSASLVRGGYDLFEASQRMPGNSVNERTEPAAGDSSAATATQPASQAQRERDARKSKERAARELAKAESDVARLDAERARIELQFADPSLYEQAGRSAQLTQELERVEADLKAAYGRWESLVEP